MLPHLQIHHSFPSRKLVINRSLFMVFFYFNSRILPKKLRSGDMTVFASLDSCSLLLSIEQHTPAVLDTATIDIIPEALAILLFLT